MIPNTSRFAGAISALKQFLARRISLHTRSADVQPFEALWSSILPETVTNPFYQIEENCYDYILRHTMYRPRHLQIHLEKLASSYHGRLIESSMIARSVRESNVKIANFYLKEYALDHPNLDKLIISQFKNQENVILYRNFRQIIEKALKHYGVTDITVDEKVDVLYTIGFFGVIIRKPPRRSKMLSMVIDTILPGNLA